MTQYSVYGEKLYTRYYISYSEATMANTYSESEVQMIELIGTYLKYRGLDAVIGINKGKEAYRLLENFGSDNVFAVAKKMLTDDDDNLRCRAAEMLMRI